DESGLARSRMTGGVLDVGDDDGVFLVQERDFARAPVENGGKNCCEQQGSNEYGLPRHSPWRHVAAAACGTSGARAGAARAGGSGGLRTSGIVASGAAGTGVAATACSGARVWIPDCDSTTRGGGAGMVLVTTGARKR